MRLVIGLGCDGTRRMCVVASERAARTLAVPELSDSSTRGHCVAHKCADVAAKSTCRVLLQLEVLIYLGLFIL